MSDTLLLILDLAGIAVFAATGALVGVRKALDVFGVMVLALITGLGGGVVRDVLIGAVPPAALEDWRYLVVPAITVAVVAYFGAYAIWGNRGVLALEDTQAKLGVRQQKLSELQASRQRLEHRIALMEKNDPDLVEELARTQLMDGAPNQVALPRH